MRPSAHPPTLRNTLRLLLASLALLSVLLGAASAQASPVASERDPIWGAPIGDPPTWLHAPYSPSQLYSEYDQLSRLAGKLITYGTVNAADCPANGYMPDGSANLCGLERARPALLQWQNQFNPAIYAAAQETGVPPALLKNIFAWESQFWPHSIFVNTNEYGLGHITEGGADSLLRWNYGYYRRLCAKTYWPESCAKPYADQPDWIRSGLRGAALQQVNADCPDCAYNLNLTVAERSISTFAHTVLANANFVALYVSYNKGRSVNSPVSYEDLWKFTLISYNAGPGCFQTAFWRVRGLGQSVNWQNVADQLDPGCQGAIDYVEFVSNTDAYHPERDPANQPQITEIPATPETSETPAAPDVETTPTPEPETNETPATPAAESSETPIAPPAAEATAEATAEPTATFTPQPTATPTLEFAPAPASADTTEQPHAANELVVKFRPFVPGLLSNAVLNNLNANVQTHINELGVVIISVPDEQLQQTLGSLQNNLLVEYAEPNYLLQAFHLPNDPYYPAQANALQAMQIPAAWDVTRGQNVIVAVIDTGVDAAHPDLQAALWQNPGETGTDANGSDKRANGLDDDNNGYVDDWQGWNFANPSAAPADDHGHGTHTAGIIAARMDNATGIAGIAPQATVMNLKALDVNGYGTYAQVAEAIVYAVNNGAQIINLGFGGSGASDALEAAVDYAESRGVLLVAAAGNTGDASAVYPAAYPPVVSVGALDENLSWAAYSTFASGTDLSAPGTGIASTLPQNAYGQLSGTSMSAAQVTGVAALLASQPQFNNTVALRTALYATAQDLGAPGQDAYYGFGLPQAANALQYLPNTGGEVTPTAYNPLTALPTQDGGVYAQATDILYADTSTCTGTGMTATNTNNALGSTAGNTGSCAGQYAANAIGDRRWRFTMQNPTTITSVGTVTLTVAGYSFSGISDDILALQVSNNNGATWNPVATFNANATNTTNTWTVPAAVFTTLTQVQNAQVQFVGNTRNGSADTITVTVDYLYLTVQDVPPTNTPTPTNTPAPSFPDPHGNFGSDTDQCAACHRTHTAQSGLALLASPLSGNAYCMSCHDGSGAAARHLSTHSNVDFAGRAELTTFELLCTQCHDSHGTSNLANIRTQLRLSSSNPLLTTGPVTFTARTGDFSFDDGVSATSARLCVACHVNSSNPGYPMQNHAGGANHAGGINYERTECTLCHMHSADNLNATKDGFMPNGGSCIGCHASPLGARRQITGLAGDFAQTSHHVGGLNTVTDDDCQVCHDQSAHQGGTVILKNVDNGTPYPLDGVSDPADYEAFCLSCHDANGAASDTRPFSDNVIVSVVDGGMWTAAAHNRTATGYTGSCRDCHSNGHGSSRVKILGNPQPADMGTPDDSNKQQEAFCYQCHDANGPAATNSVTAFGLSSRHMVASSEQAANGIRLECVSCHNPHTNNSANKVSNPDNRLALASNNTTFCLACHDGAPPAGVSFGTFAPNGMRTRNAATVWDKSAYVGSNHQIGDAGRPNIQCSACHQHHGSSATGFRDLLKGTYSRAQDTAQYAGAAPGFTVCWQCHNWNGAGPNVATSAWDGRHNSHDDDGPCIYCHDPHASYDHGELLVNFYYGNTYSNLLLQYQDGGNTVFTNLSTSFVPGSTPQCGIACHGQNHRARSFTPGNVDTTP